MFRKVILSTTAAVLASSVALAANTAKPRERERVNDHAAGAAAQAGAAHTKARQEAVRESALKVREKISNHVESAKGTADANMQESLKRLDKMAKQIDAISQKDYGQNSDAFIALLKEVTDLQATALQSSVDIEAQLNRLAEQVGKITKKPVTVEDILGCEA